MKKTFNVGDKVYSKFHGKWNVGRIEYTKMKGMERVYGISFKGAKRFQVRKEKDMVKYVELKQMEFDLGA